MRRTMRSMIRKAVICLFTICLLCPAVRPASARRADGYQRAAAYSQAHGGQATLIISGQTVAFEAYYNGYAADQPHYLASGTKSFSCAIAVAAHMDGLLTLDEHAADTFSSWRNDPRLSQITIRQLLDFTSGLDAALSDTTSMGMPDLPEESTVPLVRPRSDPGTVYQYGSSHLTVFKLLIRQKLQRARLPDRDALAYLTRKVFEPLGLRYANWLRDDGNQPELAGGAEFTAQEWAKYGLLIKNGGQWDEKTILDQRLLNECFRGSAVMPAYGLTWWVNHPVTESQTQQAFPGMFAQASSGQFLLFPDAPRDLIMAVGQGNQAMIIVPSHDVLIVHFGNGGDWDFREYVRLILN